MNHAKINLQVSIRAKHLKVTPIRLALLECLEQLQKPISIQELVELLPTGLADQVTVYRAMQSFVKAGLAREVNLRHGHVDYESASSSDHHHLVCTSCGRVEDFEECGMDELIRDVLKKHPEFSQVQEHALELFGTCKSCKKK